MIFCDTEKTPYEQYKELKRKINEFHENKNAAKEVIIFANQCTMQIVIKHWSDDVLKSASKTVNAPLIEKYTGVNEYDGHKDQIDDIMEKINKDNYKDMRNRAKSMDGPDDELGNSNILRFLEYFEGMSHGLMR